jgi:cation transport ATPase
VNRFQDMGIEVCMLTGDTLAVAQEVCLLVGINEKTNCKARLLPADKLRYIQEVPYAMDSCRSMIG